MQSQPILSRRNEQCVAGAIGRPTLTVHVADESGGEIGDASVYLGSIAVPPAAVSAQTSRLGVATLDAPREDVYVLTTASLGFVPVAQAIRLKAGCTGVVRVTLKLGPMIEER